jgi:hemoglobin
MKGLGVLGLMTLMMAGCWFDPDAGTRPITPPKEPEKPLYDRLGAEKGIQKIVDEWIARSLNDPRVNFIRRGTDKRFTPADSNVLRVKMGFVQMISAASGGSVKYEGRDMKSVHAGMKISGGEFDAMKKDLKETLKFLKVGEKEQNELFKVIESVRKDIVEVP